ncbi:MAG: hypothetical protein JKX69_15850 [Rhodobacteraceae bacterium]|nr:hypothetical protein [Paracoccaceae bacterium]
MLTDLRAAITASGAVTVNDIIAEVDAWFAPGGDFDTAGYLGDLGDLVTRRIGEDTEITFEARADDPVLREVMAATALIALAADNAGTLPAGSGAQIVSEASERLLSTGSGMATLQGRVGQEEARVEEAKARLNAEVGAMSIMYNDMISADPFDTATALQEVQNQLEMHYALTSRLSELTLTRYL